MKVVLIPDAFKDSLSSTQVALAMKEAVADRYPNATITQMAASDGGEGFLDTVARYKPSVDMISCKTVDPLGRPLSAAYLFDAEDRSAYFELARASGLEMLPQSERDPLLTSTYGTGLQIREAIQKGAKKIFVGLGGSATNDGGAGLAAALGYRFLDSKGGHFVPTGGRLLQIEDIDLPIKGPAVSFYAINDVLNPLYGLTGAAFTYARQKGAGPEQIEQLDRGLRHLAQKVHEALGINAAALPGSGAAGGTGFGLKAFFGADFIPGVSFVLGLSGLREQLEAGAVDLIITGEGTIDAQTPYGKLVSGVAREASARGVAVLAVCGKLDLPEEKWRSLGLQGVAQLYRPDKPPGYSFTHAYRLVKERTALLLGQFDPATPG
jgi:glycerate kinase